MTHIDLHLHLLPGVDDGAPDEATALEHACRMVADGVREATVTPHVGAPTVPLDPLSIPARTAELQAALDREGLGLRLHPGGEIFPETDLTTRELEAIAHGPPDARWVLAEVPFDGLDDGFFASLDAIRGRGFAVLIAHPERARGVLDGGLERLYAELARGAAFQVNVCSLLGRHGAEAQVAAQRLVGAGLAHVLASDGHPGHREHTLAAGAAPAIAAGASSVQARRMTYAHPRLLLRDGLPGSARPRDPQRQGSLERARQARRRLVRSR